MKQRTKLVVTGLAAVAALSATPARAALSDGLVVHLTFDGNYNDSSGRNNAGSAVGTPTLATGVIGGAVFVSNAPEAGGEANFVTLQSVPDVLFGDSTDFSVAMWVQLNGFNGDPAFFGNKNWNSGGNRGYVLAAAGDRHLQWNYKEDAYGRRDYDGPGDQLPTNTWVHIAMTVNRTNKITTYLNGQEVDARDARAVAGSDPSNVDTDDLSLSVNIGNDGTGSYTDGGSGVFHGNTGIDDFGLWRRELAAGDISRIYSFGKLGTNLSKIPVPTVAAIESRSPSADAQNVSPKTAINVVVAHAATGVAAGSVQLLFNGATVTPTVSISSSNTVVRYQPPALLPSGSTNSYTISFSDTGTPATKTTNSVQFVVANYPNLVLGAPFASENFEGIAEGTLPAGWSVTNATAGATGEVDLDLFRSDAYLDWVVINTTRVPTLVAGGAGDGDMFNVAPDQYVNGVEITNLLTGQFLMAQSTDRSGQQIQTVFSKDFDCTGKTNVFLYFHSAYKQNQDSLLAVEYSTDAGATWNPAAYLMNAGDIVKNPDGSVNAVTTFTNVLGDVPLVDGSATSGGTYGEFIGAPITEALAPFLSGRVDDNGTESKRVEFLRLAKADGKATVRLRIISVGSDSWYSGIDEVRFYTVTKIDPPQITGQPAPQTIVAGQNGKLTATVTGTEAKLQWFKDGAAVTGGTNATLPLLNATAALAGSYTLVAQNGGGSVTSAPVAVTTPAILADLTAVRTGLRAYLPFDGSYADLSGAGNNGTPVGQPSFAAGRIGSGSLAFTNSPTAASFNYVTLGTNFLTGTNSFSVAFWARFNGWTADPAFVANKNWNSGGNVGWVIATAGDGRVQWNYRSGGSPQPARRDFDSAGGYFTGGAWRHVVVTFDVNGDASTYVDGDLIDARPVSPVASGPDSGLALNIGQDGTGTYTDGGGVSSDGNIDEVAIWGRVLSTVEAATLFQKGRDGAALVTASTGPTLSATLGATGLQLTITGGTAPFVVQSAPALGAAWTTLLTTSDRVSTVAPSDAARFFRVLR